MSSHRPEPRPSDQTLGWGTGAVLSLGSRDFRLLWLGLIGALIGYWTYQVAQGWLVLRMSNSPLWVGVASAANNLPFLLFGLLGGVTADRVDRRLLLMATRGMMALVAAGLSVLVLTGQAALWHVLLGAFLSGVLWAFEVPARQAIIPELVGGKALFNAIALNAVVLNLAGIVGPALGGLLVAASGEGVCIAVYAVGNLGVVIALALMRYRSPHTPRSPKAVVGDAVEGVRYIWREGDVRTLVGQAAGIGVWSAAYQTLLPVFARDVYGGGAPDLGLLMSAAGLGALASAATLAFVRDFPRKGLWIMLTALAFGVTQVLLALAPGRLGGVAVLVGMGAAQTAHSALTTGLVLLITPSDYHGRVMSGMTMTWGLNLVGSIAVGALAERVGAPVAMAVSGFACVAVAASTALARPALARR